MFYVWLKLPNDKLLNKTCVRSDRCISTVVQSTDRLQELCDAGSSGHIRKLGYLLVVTFAKCNLPIRDRCLKSEPVVTYFLFPHASQTWLFKPKRGCRRDHYRSVGGVSACFDVVLSCKSCLGLVVLALLPFWFWKYMWLVIITVFNFAYIHIFITLASALFSHFSHLPLCYIAVNWQCLVHFTC